MQWPKTRRLHLHEGFVLPDMNTCDPTPSLISPTRAGLSGKIPATKLGFMASLLAGGLLAIGPATAALIAHHEFEGGFTDSTGNGHAAVPVGSGSLVSDPERGNVYHNPTTTSPRSYLNIDGTVAIPNLPANAGLTLAVWVRREAYTAGSGGNLVGALALGAGGDAPIASIGVNNSGAIVSYIEGSGGADQVFMSSANGLVANEVWTHLAVTFDRANNVGRLYLNGVRTGGDFDLSIVGDGELNWAGAHVGTLAPGGHLNWDFQGRIDDARVHDEVLSPSQILELAASGTGAQHFKADIERVGSDLVLTWNSRGGKFYDLLSATDLSAPAGDWPVWDDGSHPPYQDIAATPDENSLTIPLPGGPRRFFVVAEKDSPNPPEAVKVYLLAGQSNMQGIGVSSELQPPLSQPQDDVRFWSGTGWVSLRPGFGAYAGTSFGPELTFGRAMADALPDERIYLVKHAVGGTGLADPTEWNPATGSIYRTFINRVKAALANLTAAGIDHEVAGMLWMQGEHDTLDPADAAAYEANLTNLIAAVRAEVGAPGMPFAIGRITTELFGKATEADNKRVRDAQVAVAEAVEGASWVDTDRLQLGTPGHYGTEGQIDLGELFAGAILTPDVSWSMVVVPDSHVQPYFGAQTQWIADNRAARRIKLVLHNGDIVNTNTAAEWATSRAAMATLDGKVPYMIALGNHDIGDGGKANNRNTLLNDYFTLADNPLNHSATDGIVTVERVPGRLDNTYATFTAPDGRKMLVFSLEFGPRQEVVDWANGIASQAQFQDHTAILNTHAYLDLLSQGGRNSNRWNPHTYGVAPDVHDGEELWQELVGINANFEMTFNGHYIATVDRQQSTGTHGNVVHEMVHNRQYETQGYLRLLEFLNDGRTVRVRTRSTAGEWLADPANEFQIMLSPVP